MPRRELNARQVDTLDKLLEAARVELDEVGHEALTIRTVATQGGSLVGHGVQLLRLARPPVRRAVLAPPRDVRAAAR